MREAQELQGLSVQDLIEELQTMPPDAIVIFSCDYGDYIHTQQALPIESVEERQDYEMIQDSGYSQSGFSLEEFDDTLHDEVEWEEANEHAQKVVVLK